LLSTDIHATHTPMNGVMGMLEMLLNSDIGDKLDQLSDTAFNSETSLLAVINDILDFSKIKSGKLSLHEEIFNLADLLNEVVDQMSDSAKLKNLAFITHLPEKIDYEAVGDSVRLRQVIVNILDNAIKFTDRGEVELDVAIEIIDRIFHVDVTIRDTGKGIDPVYQATIFEPFEQEDKTNAIRDFSGTGLGLSITRDLVQLMGGEIALQSSLGKGSPVSASVSNLALPIKLARYKKKMKSAYC